MSEVGGISVIAGTSGFSIGSPATISCVAPVLSSTIVFIGDGSPVRTSPNITDDGFATSAASVPVHVAVTTTGMLLTVSGALAVNVVCSWLVEPIGEHVSIIVAPVAAGTVTGFAGATEN